MASLVGSLRQASCQRQFTNLAIRCRASLQSKASRLPLGARQLNTETSPDERPAPIQDEMVRAIRSGVSPETVIKARFIPTSPSYFSKEPEFNDLFILLSDLLTRYHHLPTLPRSRAKPRSWVRLQTLRTSSGEQIKASYFAQVLRVAKRLNLIDPTMKPAEVETALDFLSRGTASSASFARPLVVDPYGRAVASGRRKTSTARAFVVEGTGEVQVNGKTLSEVFGRVHDRESAVWPLTATQRLDKYNVWALVEGGGTTGQAEALTQAIAKALVAHEPALKTPLRKAGCITRDARMVERKKHGKLKARKMPAWVKR